VVVSVTVFDSVVVAVTVASDTVGPPEAVSVVGVTVVVSVVVDPLVTVTVVPPLALAERITAHPWDTGIAVPEPPDEPEPRPLGREVPVDPPPKFSAAAKSRVPVDGAGLVVAAPWSPPGWRDC
jgi:hypothetical protein